MFTSVILCEFSHAFQSLTPALVQTTRQYNTVNVLFSMHVLNDFQLNNYMQYINSIPCYQLLAFLICLYFPFWCVTVCIMRLVHIRTCYAYTYAAVPLACTVIKAYIMNDSVVKLYSIVKGLSLRSINSDLARALFQVSFFTLVII